MKNKQLRPRGPGKSHAGAQPKITHLALTKFIAAASHDLRQPLHAQNLLLSMLTRTELTPMQSEIVSNLSAISKSTNTMLNALIEFARIQSGMINPQLCAVPLQPLFVKLKTEFNSQAQAGNIAFHTRDTPLIVHSDPHLLELITRNLISNALRFTDRGWLLVAARKRGNHTVLEVWDTGIGIDPADQPTVFQGYRKEALSDRDQRKGLGLGLAIADGLAHCLGNTLSFASLPGQGSVFRLTLPIAK